jgi:predicted nucleotidyltransferase
MKYNSLLKKRAQRREGYLSRLEYYRAEIEEFFRGKLAGGAEVRFFGSVLTKDFDAESDVDVLVVSPGTPPRLYERSKLIAELNDRIGFANPFEIHLITEDEYQDWYIKFLSN